MIILLLLRRIQGLSHTPQMYQYWSLSEYWYTLLTSTGSHSDQYWSTCEAVLVDFTLSERLIL